MGGKVGVGDGGADIAIGIEQRFAKGAETEATAPLPTNFSGNAAAFTFDHKSKPSSGDCLSLCAKFDAYELPFKLHCNGGGCA